MATRSIDTVFCSTAVEDHVICLSLRDDLGLVGQHHLTMKLRDGQKLLLNYRPRALELTCGPTKAIKNRLVWIPSLFQCVGYDHERNCYLSMNYDMWLTDTKFQWTVSGIKAPYASRYSDPIEIGSHDLLSNHFPFSSLIRESPYPPNDSVYSHHNRKPLDLKTNRIS